MENFLKRTWAEVDLNAIDHNFKLIRSVVNKKSLIMCIIKADAYGHGSTFLAKEYEKLGADWFGVSNIDEALQLRESGIKKPILILGYTPISCADKLANYNISQAVLSLEYAKLLSSACEKLGVNVKVHIKIDSGMSRIGLVCHDTASANKAIDDIKEISKLKGITIEGMFTHFAVSDEGADGEAYTKEQFNRFKYVIDNVKKAGIDIPLCHCCNSGAIIDYPEMNLDMVRAGVILYGLAPSIKTKNKLDLKPAMKLKTVVSLLKYIEPGSSVSYGRTFISDKKMKVATVPIGYADGYSRAFSNKAQMVVCDKRVNIIGKVCMDQLILDVSDIDDIYEGAIVTVFGDELSVDELAAIANTINYEIVCLVGKRVPRIYMKDNKPVGQLNYILNQ